MLTVPRKRLASRTRELGLSRRVDHELEFDEHLSPFVPASHKPSVFFSHASVDSEPLKRLKQRFLKLTGGAVEVLVSSDGQSIPFGRNWVHEVEQALGRCRVMFVFVTPRSVSSSWLFFEAGFAYSKQIKVVPVAFLGADLNTAPGPLALLQGFNVKDAAGLNNLVATVNRELDHTHEEAFSQDDYDQICGTTTLAPDLFGGAYGALIDAVKLEIAFKGQGVVATNFEEVKSLLLGELTKAGTTFNEENDALHLEGVTVAQISGGNYVEISADSSIGRTAIPLAIRLGRIIQPSEALDLFIWFGDAVAGEDIAHKVIGRLSRDGVRIAAKPTAWSSPLPALAWQEKTFQIGFGRRNKSFIAIETGNLDLDWVEALVRLLFERRIFSQFGA